MTQLGAALDPPSLLPPAPAARGEDRLRRVFDEQLSRVWRYLRRLGLSEADADDAAQQVFMIFARKLDLVMPGKERAYLCGTAYRVAADRRKKAARRPVAANTSAAELPAAAPSPEGLADRRRARALLDQVLGTLGEDLRAVFVLYEMEEMSTAEIAAALGLPRGTVASRLRRARERFGATVRRLRAAGTLAGGGHD